jgi:hypothetical protein
LRTIGGIGGRFRFAAQVTAAVAVIGSIAACGADASDSTVTADTTPAATTQASVTVTSAVVETAAPPSTAVDRTVTFAELAALLPPLAVTVDEGVHVIELRLRTIEVSVRADMICLGGGAGAGWPPQCADVATRPGVIVWSDNTGDTRVYAVLTASDVRVQFEGEGLSCFTEQASLVGAVAVSWCEDLFPQVVQAVTPDGHRYAVVVSP